MDARGGLGDLRGGLFGRPLRRREGQRAGRGDQVETQAEPAASEAASGHPCGCPSPRPGRAHGRSRHPGSCRRFASTACADPPGRRASARCFGSAGADRRGRSVRCRRGCASPASGRAAASNSRNRSASCGIDGLFFRRPARRATRAGSAQPAERASARRAPGRPAAGGGRCFRDGRGGIRETRVSWHRPPPGHDARRRQGVAVQAGDAGGPARRVPDQAQAAGELSAAGLLAFPEGVRRDLYFTELQYLAPTRNPGGSTQLTARSGVIGSSALRLKPACELLIPRRRQPGTCDDHARTSEALEVPARATG